MIIVCDCSPLIALALCDKLALLDALFKKVVIPENVYIESTISGKPEAAKIAVWAQGKVERALNPAAPQVINLNLGKGESEAIALFWEKSADYLLIDEEKGRKIASSKGIKIRVLRTVFVSTFVCKRLYCSYVIGNSASSCAIISPCFTVR
jgi:predicted nucleic acid-binding protein